MMRSTRSLLQCAMQLSCSAQGLTAPSLRTLYCSRVKTDMPDLPYLQRSVTAFELWHSHLSSPASCNNSSALGGIARFATSTTTAAKKPAKTPADKAAAAGSLSVEAALAGSTPGHGNSASTKSSAQPAGAPSDGPKAATANTAPKDDDSSTPTSSKPRKQKTSSPGGDSNSSASSSADEESSKDDTMPSGSSSSSASAGQTSSATPSSSSSSSSSNTNSSNSSSGGTKGLSPSVGIYILPMPALSHRMTCGTLISWAKKEGEAVALYDVIATVSVNDLVEPEFATGSFEGAVQLLLESQEEGYLAKVLVQPNEEVKVGAPMAVICDDEEDVAAVAASYECPTSNVYDEQQPQVRVLTWQSYLAEEKGKKEGEDSAGRGCM